MAPRVHICFGSPNVHLGHLEEVARTGEELGWWTINRSALPGDQVVFYMVKPLSKFVATAVVTTNPWWNDDTTNDWYGYYVAEMSDVKMLPRLIPLSETREHFPEWGFLRQPRRSVLVPDSFAEDFLSFLKAGDPAPMHFAEEADIEGTKTEVIRIISQRSRRLRDLAFHTAQGICSVCRRDFSKILDGRGVRVLQVHHRQQLAARDVPAVTKISDLAVVCANCHLLLHFDPERALSIEELQEMLQVDSHFNHA
jgi:hypothetical protein